MDFSLGSQASKLFQNIAQAFERADAALGLSAFRAPEPTSDYIDRAHSELLLTIDTLDNSDPALVALMQRHDAYKQAKLSSGRVGADPRLPIGDEAASGASAAAAPVPRRPSTRSRQQRQQASNSPCARQLQLLNESTMRLLSLFGSSVRDAELQLMCALHSAVKVHVPAIAKKQMEVGAASSHLCPSTEESVLMELSKLLRRLARESQRPGIMLAEPTSEWVDFDCGVNPAALSTENPQKYIEAVASNSRYPPGLRALALGTTRLLSAVGGVVTEFRKQAPSPDVAASDGTDPTMDRVMIECFAATNCFLDAVVSIRLAAGAAALNQLLEHLALVPELAQQLIASYTKANDSGANLGETRGYCHLPETVVSPSPYRSNVQLGAYFRRFHSLCFPSILSLALLRQLLLLRRSTLYKQQQSSLQQQQASWGCHTAVHLLKATCLVVRHVGILSIAGKNSDMEALGLYTASSDDDDDDDDEDKMCNSEFDSEEEEVDVDEATARAFAGLSPPQPRGRQTSSASTAAANTAQPSTAGRGTPVLASMSPALTPLLAASASASGAPAVLTTATMPTTATAQASAEIQQPEEGLPAIDLGAPAVGYADGGAASNTQVCDFSDMDGFLTTLLRSVQLLLEDSDLANGWALQHDMSSSDKTSTILATMHAQMAGTKLAPRGVAAGSFPEVAVPPELIVGVESIAAAISGSATSTKHKLGAAASSSGATHGTPLMKSVQASADCIPIDQGMDSDESHDGASKIHRVGSAGLRDHAALADNLLSWSTVFERVRIKCKVSLLEALRQMGKEALHIWVHLCVVLHNKPLSLHAIALSAVDVVRSACSMQGVPARIMYSNEAPSVLQQSLMIVEELSSTALASQVLVSELPLSCHLDQPRLAGELPGALWASLRAEDSMILEVLHECAQWELSNSPSSVQQLPCVELLAAIELRLTRPWLRLPEQSSQTEYTNKSQHGKSNNTETSSSVAAVGALHATNRLDKFDSEADMMAGLWAGQSAQGLQLPSTRSRVEAVALLWDGARSGESVTISGSLASQRMPRTWGTAIGTKGFAPGTGVHKFDVQIRRSTGSNMFIGVATREASTSTFVGGDAHSWGLSSQSQVWHKRGKQGYGSSFDRRFTPGTTVRVTVNTVTGDVTFGSMGRSWGVTISNAGQDSNGRMRELFPAVALYSKGDEVRLRAVQDTPAVASTRMSMTSDMLKLSKSSIYSFGSPYMHYDSFSHPIWIKGRYHTPKRAQSAGSSGVGEAKGGDQPWLPPQVALQLACMAAANTLCAGELASAEGMQGSQMLLKTMRLRFERIKQHLDTEQTLPAAEFEHQVEALNNLLAALEYVVPVISNTSWVQELAGLLAAVRKLATSSKVPQAERTPASIVHFAKFDMSGTWHMHTEDKKTSSPNAFCLTIKQGSAGDLAGTAAASCQGLASSEDESMKLEGIVQGRVTGDTVEIGVQWVRRGYDSNYRPEIDEGKSLTGTMVDFFRGCISADGSAAWLSKRTCRDDSKTARSFMTFMCPSHGSAQRDALGVVLARDSQSALQRLEHTAVVLSGAALSNQFNFSLSSLKHVTAPIFSTMLLSLLGSKAQPVFVQSSADSSDAAELLACNLSDMGDIFSEDASLQLMKLSTGDFLDRSRLLEFEDELLTAILSSPWSTAIGRFQQAVGAFNSDSVVAKIVQACVSSYRLTLVPASGVLPIEQPLEQDGGAPERKEEENESDQTWERQEKGTSGEDENRSTMGASADALHVAAHFCRSPAAAAGLAPEVASVAMQLLIPDRSSMPHRLSQVADKLRGHNSCSSIEPISSFFCGVQASGTPEEQARWLQMHALVMQDASKGLVNRATKRRLEGQAATACLKAFVGSYLHHQGLASLADAASQSQPTLAKLQAGVLVPVWRQAITSVLECRKLIGQQAALKSAQPSMDEALKAAALRCQATLLFGSATKSRVTSSPHTTVDIASHLATFVEQAVAPGGGTVTPPAPLRLFWTTDIVPNLFAFISSVHCEAAMPLLLFAVHQLLMTACRTAALLDLQEVLVDDQLSAQWCQALPTWLEPLLYHVCPWLTGHALETASDANCGALGSVAGSIFTGSRLHAMLQSAFDGVQLSLVGVMRHLTLPLLLTGPSSTPIAQARKYWAWPSALDSVVFVLFALSSQSEIPLQPALSPDSWPRSQGSKPRQTGAESIVDLRLRAIVAANAWAHGLLASRAGHGIAAQSWCNFMSDLWHGTAFQESSGPTMQPVSEVRGNLGSAIQALVSSKDAVLPDEMMLVTSAGHGEHVLRMLATRVLTDQIEQILQDEDSSSIVHANAAEAASGPSQTPPTCQQSTESLIRKASEILSTTLLFAAVLFKEVSRSQRGFRALDTKDSITESLEKPGDLRDSWTESKYVGFAAGVLLPTRRTGTTGAIVTDLKSEAVQATAQALTASAAEWSLYKLLLALQPNVSLPGLCGALSSPGWMTVLYGAAHCWVAPPRLRQRAMRVMRSAIIAAEPAKLDSSVLFACGTAEAGTEAGQHVRDLEKILLPTSSEASTPGMSIHGEVPESPRFLPMLTEESPAGAASVLAFLDSAKLLSPHTYVKPASQPKANNKDPLEGQGKTPRSDTRTAPGGTTSKSSNKSGSSSSSQSSDYLAVWHELLRGMTSDLLPVLRRLEQHPGTCDRLSGEERSTAQLTTVAESVMLLRQLAGLAAWRPAVLWVFERALANLAAAAEPALEPVDPADSTPTAEQAYPLQTMVHHAWARQTNLWVMRGVATLAVMGGFQDTLRVGVLVQQVGCGLWELPGEDKLPSTRFDSKFGHITVDKEPIWGTAQRPSAAEHGPPQHNAVNSPQTLMLKAAKAFKRHCSGHTPGSLSTVPLCGGCRLFSNSTHLHAVMQVSIINALHDYHPNSRDIFHAGQVCRSFGWRRPSMATNLQLRLIEALLSNISEFQLERQLHQLQIMRIGSPLSSAVASQEMQRMRDFSGGQYDRLPFSIGSWPCMWHALICCATAVLCARVTQYEEKNDFGEILCNIRPVSVLPQLLCPEAFGNFTYAGAAGVDSQTDLPPPQLGLGTISSMETDSKESRVFGSAQQRSLVAARSGGPNNYLVALKSSSLSVQDEICVRPTDFPVDMVRMLTMQFLPALLQQQVTSHDMAKAARAQSKSPAGRAGSSRKRTSRSSDASESESASPAAAMWVDTAVLQAALRVNALRAVSRLLLHAQHSDAFQEDLSRDVLSSNSGSSLLSLLLATTSMPDQNITAQSLNIAEQGHAKVAMLLSGRAQQDAQQLSSKLQKYAANAMRETDSKQARAATSSGVAPTSAAAAAPPSDAAPASPVSTAASTQPSEFSLRQLLLQSESSVGNAAGLLQYILKSRTICRPKLVAIPVTAETLASSEADPADAAQAADPSKGDKTASRARRVPLERADTDAVAARAEFASWRVGSEGENDMDSDGDDIDEHDEEHDEGLIVHDGEMHDGDDDFDEEDGDGAQLLPDLPQRMLRLLSGEAADDLLGMHSVVNADDSDSSDDDDGNEEDDDDGDEDDEGGDGLDQEAASERLSMPAVSDLFNAQQQGLVAESTDLRSLSSADADALMRSQLSMGLGGSASSSGSSPGRRPDGSNSQAAANSTNRSRAAESGGGPGTGLRAPSAGNSPAAGGGSPEQGSGEAASGSAQSSANAAAPESDEPSPQCSMMMDMGFKREWCEFALSRTGNSLELACNFIFENMPAMDVLVENMQRRRSAATVSSSSNPALVAAVAAALQEMSFPEGWAERCVERSGATTLQAAVGWVVANFETLQREDSVAATDRSKDNDDGSPRQAEKPPAVQLGYTPGQTPSASWSSVKAKGLPQRFCCVLNGDAQVDETLELTCTAHSRTLDTTFPTVRLSSMRVSSGKWYYEVVIGSRSTVQVGWCDDLFAGNSVGGRGVGDDTHSWGWDGARNKLWHDGSSDWGKRWAEGDVVCCCLDLDSKRMYWGLNGSYAAPMGLGFAGFDQQGFLYPAISVQTGCRVQLRVGETNRPFLCGPPPGFKPVAEAVALNQQLPRDNPRTAKRTSSFIENVPDRFLVSEGQLHKFGEALASEGGAVYSHSRAWRKRHFLSGRLGHTVKVLSGAVGIGGGMRRSRDSPIAADSATLRSGPILLPSGLQLATSPNLETLNIRKLSTAELRSTYLQLSSSLSAIYSRKILVTMLALFQPRRALTAAPVLSITELLNHGKHGEASRTSKASLRSFAYFLGWMSWTSVPMLPVEIAKLAEAAMQAPLFRATAAAIQPKLSPGDTWAFKLENAVNAQGVSAAVQHVSTTSSQGFAGAAGTELSRLRSGVNLCAVIEPSFVEAVEEHTFSAEEGLYSKRAVSSSLQCLVGMFKQCMISMPSSTCQWLAFEAPGSLFEPPNIGGSWKYSYSPGHNLGVIQWLFTTLMRIAARQRDHAPQTPGVERPLGVLFDAKKKEMRGLMGNAQVFARDDDALLRLVGALRAFHEETQLRSIGFQAYCITLELFSALCYGARSGNDTFKTVVFGLLAGLCDELLRDLQTCEAVVQQCSHSAAALQLGNCLLEILEAHVSLWSSSPIDLFLSVRLEGERAASVGSLLAGAAVELHVAFQSLVTNMQRLRALWQPDDGAAQVAAALASSMDASGSPAACDAETKEEEDAALTTNDDKDAEKDADNETESKLCSPSKAASIVAKSELDPSVDDGLPGRTQHARFLPKIGEKGSMGHDAPWRAVANGAGDTLGPNCQGVSAPGFLCRNAASGDLELTTGSGQWSGSLLSHAPTNQPFMCWESRDFKTGFEPGMRLKIVREFPSLPPPGHVVHVVSVSCSESSGVLVEFTWQVDGEQQTGRLSMQDNLLDLRDCIEVVGHPDWRPIAPGGFLIEPSFAARNNLPSFLVRPSDSDGSAPTTIGSQGVMVRLSVVPHEASAPRSVANTVELRQFGDDACQGGFRKVQGLRVAGTIELPDFAGALIGVEGLWVQLAATTDQGSSNKSARIGDNGATSSSTNSPQDTDNTAADDADGATSSFWRLELHEVELLSGSAEKGWHSRFGHDWFSPGTVWYSSPTETPVVSRHRAADGTGTTLVSVAWPANLSLACDSHFSANGVARFRSGLMNLQKRFLFSWDRAAMGPGMETNSTQTVISGESVSKPRSLALGMIGFSRGVHYWEVQIVESVEPGSIMIGVAEKIDSSNQSLQNSLDSWSNNCWGIATNRLKVQPGLQQPFGELLNPGDIIGVCLDADKGHLSFFLDGMQFGEHMIRSMGSAFESLRGLNPTSSSPRVLYPCVGIRHYADSVRLLPSYMTRMRVSHGTGLASSIPRPLVCPEMTPLLGSAPSATVREELRWHRSSKVSVGSRVVDIETLGFLLKSWEHSTVFHRVLGLLQAQEASCVPATRAGGKRRRGDDDGDTTAAARSEDASADQSAHMQVEAALARFVVSGWSRVAALQAIPQRAYMSRAGILVNVDRSQAALDAVLQRYHQNLELKVDDVLTLQLSYERELQASEKVQVLGTYNDHVWYRLVSPPQGSDGAAQGFKLAWILPRALLQLLQGKPRSEYVEESDAGLPGATAGLQSTAFALKSPAKMLHAAIWGDGVPLAEQLAADKWLVSFISRTCADADLQPEQLDPAVLASILSTQDEPVPLALKSNGKLHLPRCICRAMLLVELSLLCERVVPWLHMGEQHEPGARSAGSDIAAAVSDTHAFMSLSRHLGRSTPGVGSAAACGTWRPSTLSGRVRHMRALLLHQTKMRLWNDVLQITTHPTTPSADAFEDPREIQTLRISRGPKTKPERLALVPKAEHRLRTSITGQLMEGISHMSDSSLRRSYVGKGHGGQARAFLVKLIGEGADDYGGPYRALFESVADELQADSVEAPDGAKTLLPVLTPCLNRRAALSGSQTEQQPSAEGFQPSEVELASSVYGREVFAFVGRLAGMAMRHGINLPLAFVPHVLKQLIRSPLQRKDAARANSRVSLEQLLPLGFTAVPPPSDPTATAAFNEALVQAERKFNVEVAPGVYKDLVRCGSQVQVDAGNFELFVGLAQAATLMYARDQVASLAQGMSAVVPFDLMPIWSPSEFNQLLGGEEDVSVASLQSISEYTDGLTGDEEHIQWLWEVLESGRPSDRIAFLRFVAARSRLPSSVQYLPTGLTISSPSQEDGAGPQQLPLPEAKTCFVTLSIPRYTSKEELESKLMLAIHHSPNMDADVLLHNAEGWADI